MVWMSNTEILNDEHCISCNDCCLYMGRAQDMFMLIYQAGPLFHSYKEHF
jgi:hypothetical protein